MTMALENITTVGGIAVGTICRVGFPEEGKFVAVRRENEAPVEGWVSYPSLGESGKALTAVVITRTLDVWRAGVVSPEMFGFPEYVYPAPPWFAALACYVHQADRAAEEARTASALAQSIQARLAAKDAFLDELVSSAHEYADDNSLCGEFDNFMEKHGLPPRSREHEVSVRVSADITVTVSARDQEDAEDQIDLASVVERLRELGVRGTEDMDLEYEVM